VTHVILIIPFYCPIPLAVHTGVRTSIEIIELWHTYTIIWTREWPNNTRS